MKHPETTLATVRRCLHSEISVHHKFAAPDYHCQRDVPQSKPFSYGPVCRLLEGHTCRQFEPFSENNNR
jgi:hypothetical protein